MKRVAVVLLIGMFLGGCSSLNNPLDGEVFGAVEVIEVGQNDPVTAGSAVQHQTVEGEAVDYQDGIAPVEGGVMVGLEPPAQRLFFFDYDSSSVSGEDLTVIKAHAAYLVGNPVMLVRLEGHADERGSREYNLALGERRAQTMSDLLIAEGVKSGQVEIISYGEENPLEQGAEEGFWAQNRRVELIYPQ